MKAIILARVSTEDQLTEGHSIPAQLEKAREYVRRKGFEIKSEHQFDESLVKGQKNKKTILNANATLLKNFIANYA